MNHLHKTVLSFCIHPFSNTLDSKRTELLTVTYYHKYIPLKKFDFPEPLTPTMDNGKSEDLTNGINSRSKHFWILSFMIATKSLNDDLLNPHSNSILKKVPKIWRLFQTKKYCNKQYAILQFEYSFHSLLI